MVWYIIQSTNYTSIYCHDAIAIIEYWHVAHESSQHCLLYNLPAVDVKSEVVSFNPISAHIPITLQMWTQVTLKVQNLSKYTCDEVDMTAVSVGQGLVNWVCWWQRPVFNIYLNRNAISSLNWLDQVWQWSPVFLPCVCSSPEICMVLK